MLMTARSSQPRDVDVLCALAALARRRGEPEEAIQWLEEAAEIAPDEPVVVGNLGNLYRASGELDRAVSCYRRVLTSVPDSLAAYNNLGLALKAKGELDEAVDVYRKALAIDPDSAEVNSNLGVVLLEQEKPGEAEAALRKALQTRPDSIEVRTNLGSALRALKRREDAVEVFRDVIASAPDHAEAHNNLANTLRELGRLDEAIGSYLGALRVDPDNPRTLANLATAYAALGKYDRAASVIARAAALTDVDRTLERRFGGSGASSGSEARLRSTPESERDDVRILEGVAWVHFLLGEDEEARRYYERVLALKPDDVTARHIMDSLSGRNTAAAPSSYVEALFDEYAPRFDESLLNQLSYTGPAVISEMLTENLADPRLESVVDLGCGTGLIGEAIKQHFEVDFMEGVDLSANMIEQADAKGLYDRLATADLLAHLNDGSRRFELAAAADVFVYIGNLADVFRATRRRLTDNGHFYFTVEALEGEEFRLLRTGRYAHSLAYVDRLAKEAGFRRVACHTHEIRRDFGQPITSYAVLLQSC